MQPSTETIDQALGELKALPPHSCVDVDHMLKTLQSESRDASHAAGRTEDPDACSALEHASTAIDNAAEALDRERDIAAAIRAGCDERESIIRSATRMCEERDERIEDLEAKVQTLEAEVGERDALIIAHESLQGDTNVLFMNLNEIIEVQRHRLEVGERVVKYLGEKIQKPWWRKLADTGKRLWWERKARGQAKTIKKLRHERTILQQRNHNLFDALLTADGVLSELEWETGPFGERRCPSCHVTDKGGFFTHPLHHETGCRIGQTCEAVRWALQAEAREEGMDPRRVVNERREFQV